MVRAVARPKKPQLPPKPERPTVPFHMAIRMFLLGSVAVAAAVYAIWRHYSVPTTPMLVPVPSATSSSEIPVDLEETK
jgi:hypothetical protein